MINAEVLFFSQVKGKDTMKTKFDGKTFPLLVKIITR